MGIATYDEKQKVEKMAMQYSEVRDEIKAVTMALENYALGSSPIPLPDIKNRILNIIKTSEKNLFAFPPRITQTTDYSEWVTYLADNSISTPAYYDGIYVLDLPGNKTQISYIVWAQKGMVIEEAHADEDEYLVMLEGHCSVAINGISGDYHQGDIVYIPKGAIHRAEVLSDKPMLAIGQRVLIG